MSKNRLVAATLGAVIGVGGMAFVGEASAAPGAVAVTATAGSRCDRAIEEATVLVRVRNREVVPVSVKIKVPGAPARNVTVAAGATVPTTVATGRGTLAAGTVTVTAVKTVNGRPVRAQSTAAFRAITCTLNPRIAVTGRDTDKDGRLNSATVKNVGGDPVTIRVTIGSAVKVQSVAPNGTVELTAPADDQRVGLAVATKRVDGKTYTTSRPIRP